MSAASTTAALPARRLGRGTLAAVGLLAAVALALGLLAGKGGHAARAHARASSYVAGDRSFSVAYSAGWHATALGSTGVVVERADHRGLVLVREHAPLRGKLSTVVNGLPRELARRFTDFRPIGGSATRLSTGPAVVYTFARTKAHKVQSIVIAPTARRSYTVEVVASDKARDAARQAGEIVRSLKAR